MISYILMVGSFWTGLVLFIIILMGIFFMAAYSILYALNQILAMLVIMKSLLKIFFLGAVNNESVKKKNDETVGVYLHRLSSESGCSQEAINIDTAFELMAQADSVSIHIYEEK